VPLHLHNFRPLRLALSLATVTLLSACSSLDHPFAQTALAFLGKSPLNEGQLNPTYRHLKVSLSGRNAFVTLGDIDKHPDGPIEVYYGGGGLVLRLQHGRLYGINGLSTEWRNVLIKDAPSWAVAAQKQQAEWLRIRDVMPGYRYGMREKIRLIAVPAPRSSPLEGSLPGALAWFEERVTESDLGSVRDHLPPARYAVSFANNQETVVYGEQCLEPELCLSWQLWTVSKP